MTPPSSKEVKPKAAVGRLPAISGWITECNAFRMLAGACIQGFRDHGQRIGVIRGPDFSELDGGLIFDPPEGFPMNMDPSAVWTWVNEHQQEQNLQTVPIDIKLNITARQRHQIAPLFIVAPPGNTKILCLLPIRSYTDLYANVRLAYQDSWGADKDKSTKTHRLRPREPLHVSNILAPFAVHECDLFEALLRLRNAFNGKSPYTNPSNGVTLRGWTPQAPDPNLEKLMMIQGETQKYSAGIIQKLAQTLRSRTECDMELLFNLVQPLACDLVLRDNASSTTYLIEHKVNALREFYSDNVSLSLKPEWAKEEHNWHFLLHQYGDWVTIHTRGGHKAGSNTPAVRVNLKSPGALSTIATTIRRHGVLAKQRLRAKWRSLDVYEDSLLDEESQPTEPKKSQSQSLRAAGNEMFRIAFCDAINNQCFKLGKHACILLEGNACGDAAMIRHDWTERDQSRYRSSRILPVSLVDGAKSGSSEALMLRFIPHFWTPGTSSSRIFDPARIRMIKVPPCLGQAFVYVAATMSSPSAHQEPFLDKVILLPSGDTDWLAKFDGCSTCDDESETRDWKPTVESVCESQGGGKPGSSLIQLPFLNQHAQPLHQVYDFDDGSVHGRLDTLLCEEGSPYVSQIYGPNGLLQRQWNHGSPRVRNTDSPEIRNIMRRVLMTLPPNTLPMASNRIEKILDEKQKDVMKEKSCSKSTARPTAHWALISDDTYGMSLRNIMALSGFATSYTLRCDHCQNEEECRFFLPEILYNFNSRTISCAPCWIKQKKVCTFQGIANTPELVDEIRSFEWYRHHVPCNQYYSDEKQCDNRADLCERYEASGKECVREACKNGSESRDDSSCPKACDKAHEDDGYTNVTTIPRGKGCNARLRLKSS
ncbi:hypothetical protein yc1106_02753 [Curvularia clavata]|uniref:Uncharacterized protein n=1 Tax=Curvularia clavata TaxID=95742 RepID=A0A9Q8Z3U2_CURCL|nr:hypothetical protein yc1106_02753 [Curvularia clavata]